MTFFWTILQTAFTLCVAAAGGALFYFLHLPAAWLTGSMIPVAALALFKVPVSLPEGSIRSIILLLMGVSLGCSFTPEAITDMLKWPASLASLALTIVLVMATCIAFLIFYAKWDRATAFFAVVPGALSSVLILAMQSPADTRLVVLAQSFRLLVLMAVLPIVVVSTMPPEFKSISSPLISSYSEIVSEIIVGAVLGFALEKIRFPGGLFSGGMLGAIVMHFTGFVSGQMSSIIFIPCQIVLGAFIGLRFSDVDLTLIRKALVPSVGVFLIAFAISGLAALTVAWLLHIPLGMVLVAFAPGGLEAMSILALVLGLDPAFVGAHQFARFVGISMLLPLAVKLYLGDATDNKE